MRQTKSAEALSPELKRLLQAEKIPVKSLAEIEKNIASRAAAQMQAYLQTARQRLQCQVARNEIITEHDQRIREILALLHNTPSLADAVQRA